MIAKRIAAAATALLLIVAAIGVRGLIDDDGDDASEPSSDATLLVCPTELAVACRSIELPDGVELRIEESGQTLDALAGDGVGNGGVGNGFVWLTYDPFPAAVDGLRRAQGRQPIELAVEQLASSPIVLVTADDPGCGEPVAWRCLGESGSSIGFASDPDSGIGLLGAVSAADGYGDGATAFGDALFEVWFRGVLTSVNRSQLSTGTAIATIQVRPSAIDVAVGAEAELAAERRSRFQVLYAGPMHHATAVLAADDDTSIPDGLADDLRAALVAAGWTSPPTPSELDAAALLATRDFWRSL